MLALWRSLEPALSTCAGARRLLFCSARAGEGKTTVVGELATLLAQNTSNRIAVIDAGLRQDLASRYAASPCIPFERLVSTWKRSARPEASPIEERRFVLATAPDSNADSRLALARADSWVALKPSFDFVLAEMPALADSSLAVATARHFDGVVLVIESGRTRWPIVLHAREQLQRAGATILGAFLNKRVFYIPRSLYRWL
jgi:Mrp family chromosome partitioning ATPase